MLVDFFSLNICLIQSLFVKRIFMRDPKTYLSKPAVLLCELYIETNSTVTSVHMRKLLQWNRYLHVKRDQTSITVSRRER